MAHGEPRPYMDPKLAKQRKAQDRMLGERHHAFGLAAQDNHAKSERFHFAVVGDPDPTARALYLYNYDLIDWTQ